MPKTSNLPIQTTNMVRCLNTHPYHCTFKNPNPEFVVRSMLGDVLVLISEATGKSEIEFSKLRY